MNLFHLLNSLGKKPLQRLAWNAFLSALSTTIVLAVITYAANEIDDAKEAFVDLPLAIIFVVSTLVYMFAESAMIAKLASDIEIAIDQLRMKLIHRLRCADLWKLEHFGQSRLFGNITQNCKIISSNSHYIAQEARSIIQLVVLLIYIATISLLSCFLLTVMLVVGAFCYYRIGKSLELSKTELVHNEIQLFEYVSDLFDGFKEQRLCSVRSRIINEEFSRQSLETVVARSQVHRHTWKQFVFGETMFNIMLGIVVFIVPIYSPSVSNELLKISVAVLFMITPIFSLIQSLVVLRAADDAAGQMIKLKDDLAELEEKGSLETFEPLAANFSEIKMEKVEFVFPAPPGERGFSIGPIDMSIKRGEVVFISGGNGAGKSTFIKLLTGLYHPQRGKLSMDGITIVPSRLAGYRILIAPVFSDFHLFSKLYGLTDNEIIEADDLLSWMEMENISVVKDKQFTRTDLSTGQRKRLALIAALLEAKPILILDEWAADQDSQFRQKFYKEILPELRRKGLTIIAVTHDDRYFDAADRRFHLDEGKITVHQTTAKSEFIYQPMGGER